MWAYFGSTYKFKCEHFLAKNLLIQMWATLKNSNMSIICQKLANSNVSIFWQHLTQIWAFFGKIQILTHINPKKSKIEFLDKIWNFGKVCFRREGKSWRKIWKALILNLRMLLRWIKSLVLFSTVLESPFLSFQSAVARVFLLHLLSLSSRSVAHLSNEKPS